MDQRIDAGGVKHVSVQHATVPLMHVVSTYIHHELTPERREELAGLVERVIIRAIQGWVAP